MADLSCSQRGNRRLRTYKDGIGMNVISRDSDLLRNSVVFRALRILRGGGCGQLEALGMGCITMKHALVELLEGAWMGI